MTAISLTIFGYKGRIRALCMKTFLLVKNLLVDNCNLHLNGSLIFVVIPDFRRDLHKDGFK